MGVDCFIDGPDESPRNAVHLPQHAERLQQLLDDPEG